jgi:hypothetical protein
MVDRAGGAYCAGQRAPLAAPRPDEAALLSRVGECWSIEESVAGSIDKEAFDGPLAIFSADAARTRRGAAGFTTRSPVA